MVDAILVFALRMPDARERVAVLEDLLAFIRERAQEPGTSAAGVQTLHALEAPAGGRAGCRGRGDRACL